MAKPSQGSLRAAWAQGSNARPAQTPDIFALSGRTPLRLPGDLEREIDAFTAYYNKDRYHESLCNLAAADFTSGAMGNSCNSEKGSKEKP